jgi:hypothetical protein
MKSLEQCLSVVEKSSLCKKKKLKRTSLREFITHTYLVLLGVRSGFLVDCFSLDATSLHALLELVLSTLIRLNKSRGSVSSSVSECVSGSVSGSVSECVSGRDHDFSRVVVVQLPTDDFLLLAPAVFVQCRERECGVLHNALLVDISGHTPTVVSAIDAQEVVNHLSELRDIILTACDTALATTTSPSHGPCAHIDMLLLEPDTTVVGYECVAGWLLGYECVYNCASKCGGGYQQSLSMLPLSKVSISVAVQWKDVHVATVKEYTVPLCVLTLCEECTSTVTARTCTCVTTQQFNEMVSSEFECMKSSLDGEPLLQGFTMETAEVSYSSLAF